MQPTGRLGRMVVASILGVVMTGGSIVAGAELASGTAAPPSQIGAWASPVALPANVVGVHAVVLDTGKVLLLTGFGGQPVGYVFDPSTGTVIAASP